MYLQLTLCGSGMCSRVCKVVFDGLYIVVVLEGLPYDNFIYLVAVFYKQCTVLRVWQFQRDNAS